MYPVFVRHSMSHGVTKPFMGGTLNNLMTDLIALLNLKDLHWNWGPPCLVSIQLDRLLSRKLACLPKTLETSRRKDEVTVILSIVFQNKHLIDTWQKISWYIQNLCFLVLRIVVALTKPIKWIFIKKNIGEASTTNELETAASAIAITDCIPIPLQHARWPRQDEQKKPGRQYI